MVSTRPGADYAPGKKRAGSLVRFGYVGFGGVLVYRGFLGLRFYIAN
jgi:hypothetical protein